MTWLSPLLVASARFSLAGPAWVPRPLRRLPFSCCVLVVRLAVWRSQ